MKKFIFSLFFFSMMIVSAQAQKTSCAKTCTKSSAASAACKSQAPGAASVSTADLNAEMAKVASMDASIETRKDPATGNVSYVRKETCSHSGKVSYVDLSYDASAGSFVNVSPMKMEGKSAGSGCSSKATSVNGKACCSKGVADGKACCAGKAASMKSAEKVKS
jgi:hypothetical protein